MTGEIPGEHAPRLTELTKDEARAVMRHLDRGYSDEKFEAHWQDFITIKQARLGCAGEA